MIPPQSETFHPSKKAFPRTSRPKEQTFQRRESRQPVESAHGKALMFSGKPARPPGCQAEGASPGALPAPNHGFRITLHPARGAPCADMAGLEPGTGGSKPSSLLLENISEGIKATLESGQEAGSVEQNQVLCLSPLRSVHKAMILVELVKADRGRGWGVKSGCL